MHINPLTISEIASFIRSTGKYEVNEAGGFGTATHTYIIRKEPTKTWTERNPVKDKIRTGFITFLFSVIASLLLLLIPNHKSSQYNNQQNKRLDSLVSSIDSLEDKLKGYEKPSDTSNDSH